MILEKFLRSKHHIGVIALSMLCVTGSALAETSVGPARLLLTTQDWPPYQEYKNGTMQGIALDKVKCALSEMGQPYQITMTKWSEAQLKVHSGAQHGFFVATKTKERDEYATLSLPIAEQKLDWYFAPGVEPKLTELSKINLKFSAKFGSNKWFWLKRHGYNVVKQPRNAKVLLKLLKDREIDVALEDELVFNSALEQASLPADYFKRQVLETKNMGVYFSKRFLEKYPGFLKAFNSAILKCEG